MFLVTLKSSLDSGYPIPGENRRLVANEASAGFDPEIHIGLTCLAKAFSIDTLFYAKRTLLCRG